MSKNRILLVLAMALSLPANAYNDHRGHNLDSLERVVAQWTPEAMDKASDTELAALNRDFRDLMLGYSALNSEKCIFYARKALAISERKGWEEANADACRYIGQCYWGNERYDSSMFYYRKALDAVDRMQEDEADDQRSALYGAIGNLYNMMDSIPQAMEWYGKAGEIFDRHGWNQSNAVLYYNIGETWMEQGDWRKAKEAYERSLDYGQGDSLMVAMAQKGLGRLYMEQGRTWKALDYLHKADEYFACHEKEELGFRKENFEYMSAALLAQRKQVTAAIVGILLILLLAGSLLMLARRLRSSRKSQMETTDILEETIEDLGHIQRKDPEGKSSLVSEREKEILDLLAKGYTTPQIASCLCLSPETIKWYRKKLLVKFDVANTAELVLKAKDMA